MKKFIYTLLTCLVFIQAHAQEPCSTGRFASDVYPDVTVTSNIIYGSNLNFNGSTKTLKLDFYEPTSDTMQFRPLIVWVHSGSFLGGTKTDQDVVDLSTSFAKKGYVCASIDYRTGFFPIDSVNSVKAVLRAVHDLKAAVRFFYKDRADEVNQYKIDTNNIFIGGTSAGAITALHYEFLDRTCEINDYINQATLDQVGGMEGISGNPCYSTDVKAVINLCGALARYSWLEAGNVPFCSMHGTEDGTVSYSRGMVNPGVPLMYLDGSRMLYEQANTVVVDNPFYTFYGADHDPFLGTSAQAIAYMDTTINFVRDFLIDQLGCSDSPLQAENTPFGSADLYTVTPCSENVPFEDCTSLGISSNNDSQNVSVYPNPVEDEITLEFNTDGEKTIKIIHLNGSVLKSYKTNSSLTGLDVTWMESGVYFVNISDSEGLETNVKFVKL